MPASRRVRRGLLMHRSCIEYEVLALTLHRIMPDRGPGFTPINHPEGFSSDPESSPTQHIQKNQGGSQGSATRRRTKNQLIRNYLSPGKSTSGVSMFERAAISHGEEPQVKKRKTRKSSGEKRTDQNAQLLKQSSDRPRAARMRTVSEGMRTTKPGAFAPLKPQDPAFNPRSAADRRIVQDDNDPQQTDVSANSVTKLNALGDHGHPAALDDKISVVAPVTSMDIISTPTSSMTMDSLAMHSKPSQKDTHSLQRSPQTNTPVISTIARQCESRMSSLKDIENDEDDVRLFTQTNLFNRRRAFLPSQSPRLRTIIEEFEPAASQEFQSRNDGFDRLKQARNIQEDHADVRDKCTQNTDEFDILNDGLTEGDLLHCLGETEAQKVNRGPSSATLTAEPIEEQDLSQAIDSWDVEDEFFEEDWDVLEDEDNAILEQAAASMDPATILNQVSSNVQKVRATPATVSTCGEPGLQRSPDLKPILRPPFPERVQDRSPIIGLSAAICLRTCFRIGEALNVGSQAVREHQTVFIELYARVRWSFREPRSVKQHFTFMDLFHDRPPYLDGTYEIWKGVELYEQDSGRFLERSARPLLCRCVGKLKRDGTSWKLTILSIWEATMDDVENVSGIVQLQCET